MDEAPTLREIEDKLDAFAKRIREIDTGAGHGNGQIDQDHHDIAADMDAFRYRLKDCRHSGWDLANLQRVGFL